MRSKLDRRVKNTAKASMPSPKRKVVRSKNKVVHKTTRAHQAKQSEGEMVDLSANGQIGTSTNSMYNSSSAKKVQPQKATSEKSNSNLPVGGIVKHKLCLPGLFDLIIETQHDGAWFTQLYKSLEGKYWRKVPRLDRFSQNTRNNFDCLICETRFNSRPPIIAHLNRHMGLYVGHCTLCSRKYFNIKEYRKHIKLCGTPKI